MYIYSLGYFVILPILFVAYYILPANYKALFLLLTSLAWVYSYNASSVIFILFFNTLNFFLGLKLQEAGLEQRKTQWLNVSVIVNFLAILFINKFFSGYLLSVGKGSSFLNHLYSRDTLLAVGLNFYALQHISYAVDISKKRIVAEDSYIRYSLYNSFFPRVLLGPVLRYADFRRQLDLAILSFDSSNVVIGVKRILLGILKKGVLADRLAPITSSLYDAPNLQLSGANAWTSAILYFLQLYFEFSGLIDIAIGTAKLFGFDLRENFDFPLRSKSISEFWRRWHITFMDWLTNYVYFPVNFSLRRSKKYATILAVLATFFVSGIWHGWGITFLIYALLHGVYIIIEFLTKKWRQKFIIARKSRLLDAMAVILVFLLVSITLVFFRGGDMQNTMRVFRDLFMPGNFFDPAVSWRTWAINGGGSIEVTFNNRLGIILSIFFILYERKITALTCSSKVNFGYLFTIILLIVIFGVFGNVQRFIYLQF